MNTRQSIFQNQAALVRTAIPGYRILRRVVGLQCGPTVGAGSAGRGRRAGPHTYPLAAG